MIKKILLLTLFSFVCSFAYGEETLKSLGKFKDWESFVLLQNGNKICYAQSIPIVRAPKKLIRDPSRLFVSFRPAENIKNEISVTSGYEFKLKKPVTAKSGKKTYDLFSKGRFAWIVDNKDETKLALKTSQMIGSNHFIEFINKEMFEDNLENFFHHMDQPSIDGINTYFTSLIAKKLGLKVVLSGLGADEIFMGYKDFKDIRNLVKYFGPLGKLLNRGQHIEISSSGLIKKFFKPKYASLLEYSTDFSRAFILKRAVYMPWELPDILGFDFFNISDQLLIYFTLLKGKNTSNLLSLIDT